MIEINVSGSIVSVQGTEALYCGSQDSHICRFTFDDGWDGFFRSAVFRVNGKTITTVIDEDGACVLPWELLVRSNIGCSIEVGVYGVSAGKEILTSEWDSIGSVRDGSELGNDAREPSAGVWEQMTARVQKLDEKVADCSEDARTQAQRAESAATIAEESIAKADGSAAAAANAAGAAVNALQGIRKALEAIPEGATPVVNDLTTGGAAAALSAEMGKVLAERPNRNMVDNGYLLQPVNQQGMTEYAGAYFVDRWSTNHSGTVKVTVGSKGVTFENNTTTAARFYQQLFEEKLPAGTYTLSVLVTEFVRGDEGTKVSFNFNNAANILNTPSDRMEITGNGLFTKTLTIAEGVCDRVRGVLPVGASVTLAAVKLERGSVQTLAHQDADGHWVLNEIPDYAEELAKCQRYYQLFSGETARPAAPADYRPAMRANPAVGTIVIDGTTYYYADANL